MDIPTGETLQSKLKIAAEIAAVLVLLALALWALPVTQVLDGGPADHALMLLRMVALLLAVTWLLGRTGRSWADVGLTRPDRWWRATSLVVGGYILLGAVLTLALPMALGLIGAQPPALHAFTALRGNLLQYLFFALPVSWGTAAFVEEMFARGYLLNRLTDLFGSTRAIAWWAAAAAQGVLFGLGHAYQGAGGVVMTSLVGMTFGAIYLLGKRNLWACIILHGLVDFVSVTAFYLGRAG
jgi:membrane protease YdiL (CAAX protease family)